jgi:hypothetical protein
VVIVEAVELVDDRGSSNIGGRIASGDGASGCTAVV